MFMWAMSDRGIPRSYRMIQGFGVNTFTLINAKGERHFVKFVWTPELGVHSLVWDEALKLAGQDPDFHRKDLNEAIENGVYPKWRFGIQVIPEGKEHEFEFDILDATKVWPEELVPIQYIGELVLNKTPDEFFTEVEQVAFCTSHLVPGIGTSDDPLLQGRNFSYMDTQLTRLGVNWQELPINRPVCPVMNFNRDGAMKHRIHKGKVNYWPNRFEAVPPTPVSQGGYLDYAQKIAGIKARAQGPKFKEHYKQARMFYNSLKPHEKKHLAQALSFELDHCDEPIVYERMCQRLADIDLGLAKDVAMMVGGPIPEKSDKLPHKPDTTSKGLSQTDFEPSIPTISTRKVAILIADGFDATAVSHIKKALAAAGAIPMLIAPRRKSIKPANGGEPIQIDHHFEGMRSTMFDAVIVPPGRASVDTLKKNGRAVHYVREAFGHLKAVGGLGEGVELLQVAIGETGVELSSGVNNPSKVVASYGVVTQSAFDSEAWSTWKILKDEFNFVSSFFYEMSQHRNWQRELDGLNEKVAY